MNTHEEMADPAGEQFQVLLELLAARGPGALDAVDAELAGQAQLALRLAEVLPARPDPAFRAALQMRLQAEGSQNKGVLGSWRRSRRLHALLPRLAAVVIACVLVVSSAVVASADALPGDALYRLKRAAEEARVLLVLDPAERARQRLLLAQERLEEVVALSESGAGIDPASLALLLEAQRRALTEAAGTPGAEAAVRAWSEDAAQSLRALRGLDAEGAMLVREAADRMAGGASPGRVPLVPTAPAAQGTLEAAPTAQSLRGEATAAATASLRAPTSTAAPLPTLTPRVTPTAETGVPLASAPPPTPIPLLPTVVAGQTDPAVNPGATERAINLTVVPRDTQAVPSTPDSPPGLEPPSEPDP